MTFMPIGQTGPTLVEKNPLVHGSIHGETGFATKPQNSSEIATWLATKAPADVDKAAVSRALSHGVTLEVKCQSRFPTGRNGEQLPSYEVAVGCDIAGANEQRQLAKADLEKFMTPAPVRIIEGWLAELSVITAGRGREGFDAELMVTAYSSRLSRYPADVVRFALLEKTWRWFPAWEELEVICRAKSSPRKYMLFALSQPEPEPESGRRPATQAERDRIAELIAELFPTIPQAWRNQAMAEIDERTITGTEKSSRDRS